MVAAVLGETLTVPSLELEHLVERQAVSGGALLGVLHPVAGLVLDQRVRQLHVDPVDHGLERAIADHTLGLALLRLVDLLAEVGAELVERVELGRGRGEVVVGLGELEGLHVLDQDREVRAGAAPEGSSGREGGSVPSKSRMSPGFLPGNCWSMASPSSPEPTE